jgi:hypothetical protein
MLGDSGSVMDDCQFLGNQGHYTAKKPVWKDEKEGFLELYV